MSSTLIRNARIASTGDAVDLLVKDGRIHKLASANTLQAEGASTIDGSGCLILPGLFDLHVHFDQPGHESRECVKTASAAALQGGITGLQVMPDCATPLDNAAQIISFMDACRRETTIDIVPSGSITKGLAGEEQASYDSLRSQGVRFITDADKTPENILLLYRAMQYAGQIGMTFALRGDLPSLTSKSTIHPGTTAYKLGLTGSPACAEEIGIETVIRLSAETDTTLHIQTVSTAGGSDIIRKWKKQNAKLTSEVALHHLIFTHENVGDYNTSFKTLPPLRNKEDKEALVEAIKDGTIDCIVTDHTPCKPFAKKQDFVVAPHGMIGLDTFLPAIYHHLVNPGLLDWQTIIAACSDNSRKLAGRPPISISEGEPANFTLFAPEESTEVTDSFLKSRAQNSPFKGTMLQGKVKAVCLGDDCFQF